MRQVWITKAGPPEVLQVRETPDPEPGASEVRIRVEAAGVNFADVLARMGLYPDLPGIPIVVGYEVAGRVDAVGSEVSKDWVGKEVVALTRFGGYSDVTCVPEDQVFLRPQGMGPLEGAALPVNYLTAYQLIVVMGGLRRGETVLVHAAAGGVGIACVQLARHVGARVIGTASASKHDFLRQLGVEHCIDYTTEDFEPRVLALTEGKGVELICDAVGGKSFSKGFRVLSATGRLGMFGISSAATGKSRRYWDFIKTIAAMPWFKANPVTLMNQNKGIFGVNMGRMWHETKRIRGWMDDLLDLHAQGAIKPHVDRAFSFADAPAAHHYIQERKNIGKVLLVPG
ncbi:MAG: zinc-binding dehydrogenase [Deltaproteobacteria bacterium]|nr:zinc-binding dehydrogenase [Deltaproteobacteria bacterium]